MKSYAVKWCNIKLTVHKSLWLFEGIKETRQLLKMTRTDDVKDF